MHHKSQTVINIINDLIEFNELVGLLTKFSEQLIPEVWSPREIENFVEKYVKNCCETYGVIRTRLALLLWTLRQTSSSHSWNRNARFPLSTPERIRPYFLWLIQWQAKIGFSPKIIYLSLFVYSQSHKSRIYIQLTNVKGLLVALTEPIVHDCKWQHYRYIFILAFCNSKKCISALRTLSYITIG